MAFTFALRSSIHPAAVSVPTNGMALSSGGPLSTTNASNCVVIVIHAPIQGAGAMAHVSPGHDEGPVIQAMVDYLTQRGAAANALDVLVAGCRTRESDGGWVAHFTGELTGAGLAVANVHDARTQRNRTDIGPNGRDGMVGLVYYPTTGQIGEIGPTQGETNLTDTTVGVSSFSVQVDGQAIAVPRKSKGCYVTTATCAALGLPDDCEELETLRWYRDTVLLRDPARQGDVAAYYASAPAIVATIEASPDAAAIYASIYREGVTPAIEAIRRGDFEGAYSIYRSAMEALEQRFAPSREG